MLVARLRGPRESTRTTVSRLSSGSISRSRLAMSMISTVRMKQGPPRSTCSANSCAIAGARQRSRCAGNQGRDGARSRTSEMLLAYPPRISSRLQTRYAGTSVARPSTASLAKMTGPRIIAVSTTCFVTCRTTLPASSRCGCAARAVADSAVCSARNCATRKSSAPTRFLAMASRAPAMLLKFGVGNWRRWHSAFSCTRPADSTLSGCM